MEHEEEECPMCGCVNDVELNENGSCERCGAVYVWTDIYDEESDEYIPRILWTDDVEDPDDADDEEN